MEAQSGYVFPVGEFAKSLYWNETQAELTELFALTENNKLEIFNVQRLTIVKKHSLQQETVVYDISILQGIGPEPLYITSCKDMPVQRFFTEATHSCLGSIPDRKENSERYLSPLALRQSKEQAHKCFGAGLKFLSSYDLNRCARSFRFKQFDKKQLSALALQPSSSEQLLAVGQFTGEIHVVSPANNTVVATLKCHVDGITDLKFLPCSPMMLLSSARYDDFKYLWDLRMTQRFLNCYHLPNSSNQRTNLQLSVCCKYFLTGSQSGDLWRFPIDTAEKPVSCRLFNQSLNWVERAQKGMLAVCSGERHFDDYPAPGGTLRVLQNEN